MKLSLTQENLSKALVTVGRVVSSRSSLPVLGNVLLSTDSSRLKLAATNLEIGINYWIGSKIEQEGSITIPARLLSEFISSLPAGNIELAGSETNLTLKTPHYQSTINGIAADEFPLIPEIKTKAILTLPASQLHDAISQIVVAASLDENRPVLAGVYFYINDDQLVLAATDSFRLAERRLNLKDKPNKELSVIIPTRTIQELIRIVNDATGDVQMFIDENQVMFKVDSIELTSRLIEGQFPNYQQIIPEKVETTAIVDNAEFSRITKVASLFARENAGSIRLEIQAEGQVTISSSTAQVGENNSTAECEVRGDDGEISLNSRYLSEALGTIKSKRVDFSISGKLNPCVIRPEEEPKDGSYLHIIMPLRT